MDMDDVINAAPERLLSNGYTEYFSYEGREFKKGHYIVLLQIAARKMPPFRVA